MAAALEWTYCRAVRSPGACTPPLGGAAWDARSSQATDRDGAIRPVTRFFAPDIMRGGTALRAGVESAGLSLTVNRFHVSSTYIDG